MKIVRSIILKIWQLEMNLRRRFYSYDSRWRERLYDRKRRIASQKDLTKPMKYELESINVKLGNFPRRFRLKPDEIRRRREFSDKLIKKILEKKSPAHQKNTASQIQSKRN